RHKFYLKNATVLERLAQVDAAIFDKTGTLTSSRKDAVDYQGMALTQAETDLLKSTLRGSNHPLSRSLYERLRSNEILTLDEFREHTGKGVEGRMDRRTIKVGSAAYVGGETQGDSSLTEVYVSADDTLKGRFVFNNSYREGLSGVFGE